MQKYTGTINVSHFSVLDANGRIPTGVMKGNDVSMGLYDECVDVEHLLDDDNVIKGKYCYSGLVIPLSILDNITKAMPEYKNYVSKKGLRVYYAVLTKISKYYL